MDIEQVEKAYEFLLEKYSLYVTAKFLARKLGDDERAFVRAEAGKRWGNSQEQAEEQFGEPVVLVAKDLLWKRQAFPQYPARAEAA